ncbi:RNA-dependent DNA polymerase [Phytophthora megakarya]|uniref:RNA-dependent DNA polymerase n=1 Tax=Phytophthora megakarya TaxID=4795 RepID=A0A225WYQ7_9STRA|nr:RNA-dependent DNA polymerase [Phytophthora megakarya]
MEYLGHGLSAEGVRALDRLVHAFREFPTPTNGKEAKRFVHLAGYYSRFVKDFGTIMAPLTKILRKNINQIKSRLSRSEVDINIEAFVTISRLQPSFQIVAGCEWWDWLHV